jgi:hypothetical protein
MKGLVCWQASILILASLLAVVVAAQGVIEGFAATSTGTMIQLRTSHVRTEEDDEYERNILPHIINQDLIHMTGSGLF